MGCSIVATVQNIKTGQFESEATFGPKHTEEMFDLFRKWSSDEKDRHSKETLVFIQTFLGNSEATKLTYTRIDQPDKQYCIVKEGSVPGIKKECSSYLINCPKRVLHYNYQEAKQEHPTDDVYRKSFKERYTWETLQYSSGESFLLRPMFNALSIKSFEVHFKPMNNGLLKITESCSATQLTGRSGSHKLSMI